MESKLPYLTDDHLKAVGHVAIRSAQLDHTLELALAVVFDPNFRTAEALLKQTNTKTQIDMLKSYLVDTYPLNQPSIETFIESVKAARSERNDVLHFIWGKVDEDGFAELSSRRPFRQNKERNMTAGDVMKIAGDLLWCTNTLSRLINHFLDGQQPSSHNALLQLSQQPNFPWPLNENPPEGLLGSEPPE